MLKRFILPTTKGVSKDILFYEKSRYCTMKSTLTLSMGLLIVLSSCHQLYRAIPKAKRHHSETNQALVDVKKEKPSEERVVIDVQEAPQMVAEQTSHQEEVVVDNFVGETVEQAESVQQPTVTPPGDSLVIRDNYNETFQSIYSNMKTGVILTGAGVFIFFPFLYLAGIVTFLIAMRKFKRIPEVDPNDLNRVQTLRKWFHIWVLMPLIALVLIVLFVLFLTL